MINTDNIEVIAINSRTVSVDGDLFYYCKDGFMTPYCYFDMIKVKFKAISNLIWIDNDKILMVPIKIVKERNDDTYYLSHDSVFFLKKDLEFVNKLISRFVGIIFSGPELTPHATSINSNGKLPKVIKMELYDEVGYWYYDRASYDKYR